MVRDAYEQASHAYRGDEFDYADSPYAYWLDRFMRHLRDLRPAARVLDAGCGNGLPVARELARFAQVTGVDLSPRNVERARHLVPDARFQCDDLTTVEFAEHSFDAVVAFYSLINIPLTEQPGVLQRFARWLAPGGRLLITVGQDPWTGIETEWRGVPGVQMYYSHSHVKQYREWIEQTGLIVEESGRIPLRGDPGYAMISARKPDPSR